MEYTLQVGNFKPLVCVIGDIAMGHLLPQHLFVLPFPILEKSNISLQVRFPQKREHLLSGFQTTEAHCNHLVPTEHLVVEWLNWPS